MGFTLERRRSEGAEIIEFGNFVRKMGLVYIPLIGRHFI